MMEIAIESVISTPSLYHWYVVTAGGSLTSAVSVTVVSPPSQQKCSSPVTSMVGLLGSGFIVSVTSVASPSQRSPASCLSVT
ncbi:hypothetical protein ES708_08920 [subsurface metagenome]